MSTTVKDAAIGATSGFVASFLMDGATNAFLRRQSEASVRRQDELAPGGAPAVLVRRTARVAGVDLSVERSQRYALVLHRTLASSYGLASAALVRPTRPPMLASLIATGAALALVDEGLSILRIVPAPQKWPWESHVRGVLGHLTLAVGIGALLALADRLVGLDGRRN
jgi:hypothetical protein